MEKLIKLLNEYEIWKTKDKVSQNPKRSRRKWSIGILGGIFGTLMNERESRLSIISKSYGFIQWLCDEDKIDLFKLPKEFENICGFGLPNRIVMILSIQDRPIEFLLSILK